MKTKTKRIPNRNTTALLRLAASAAILLLASSALTQEAAKQAYSLPEDGNLAAGAYTNDYFGFRYPLPPGWKEDLEGPEPSVSGYYSLVALKSAEPAGSSLLIAAQDNFFAAQPARDALDFLSQMKQHLDPSFAPTQTPTAITIAGRPFARLDYEGAGLHHAVFVTQIRCHFVIFSITSGITEQIRSVAASLEKISFAVAERARLPVCIRDYAGAEHLVHRVNPVAVGPPFATVPVRIVIDSRAKVVHTHAIAGFPEQMKSATDALAQWQFKPYEVDGKTVVVETGVLMQFRGAPQ